MNTINQWYIQVTKPQFSTWYHKPFLRLKLACTANLPKFGGIFGLCCIGPQKLLVISFWKLCFCIARASIYLNLSSVHCVHLSYWAHHCNEGCGAEFVRAPTDLSNHPMRQVHFFGQDFTRQRPWQRPEGHYEFPSKTALNSSFLELSWNALKIIYLPHTTLWCTTKPKGYTYYVYIRAAASVLILQCYIQSHWH